MPQQHSVETRTKKASAARNEALIRNEPVQARSAARLDALLDAAAAVVDEIGYERLTTAMVAEGAGASIGTVYRYFPDRIAVLQALSQRNHDRLLARLDAVLADEGHGDWDEALTAVFDALADAFRTEPSFASLRVGDVLDLRPPAHDATAYDRIADETLDRIASSFGLTISDDARFDFHVCLALADALLGRAFARDPKGDKRHLEAGRTLMSAAMQRHLGGSVKR
ncbi:TetR/AcrR family transcriptional regulator [Ruicaihuangia caeni]|uniref:TetR/AcrR family transcriptional regulator n=1 Tax=Ruicaihuangia caeni TaxID=3042517 RepID=A0AAW6T277_9MICO|nr:TetR/AcrR family transcriptional regulator [Klugiella sp. YN-L-19]MDI2097911.1 TetR/AcrR family transcriptional regulator [Klugiella sp. YN-L-19]